MCSVDFCTSFHLIMWTFYCVCCACSVLSDSLRHDGPQPTRLLCQWDSPGKDTRVHCHALLEGIFLTQGSSLHLLHLLHWEVGCLPHGTFYHPLLKFSFEMQSYRRPIRKNKYRGHILIQLLEQRKAVPSKLKMLDFQREMLVLG